MSRQPSALPRWPASGVRRQRGQWKYCLPPGGAFSSLRRPAEAFSPDVSSSVGFSSFSSSGGRRARKLRRCGRSIGSPVTSPCPDYSQYLGRLFPPPPGGSANGGPSSSGGGAGGRRTDEQKSDTEVLFMFLKSAKIFYYICWISIWFYCF